MKTKKAETHSALDVLSSASYATYTAHICGDGKILQIEERIGRKHLRAIDPLSKYGRQLLKTKKVLFYMPDGSLVRGTSITGIILKLKNLALDRMQKLPENSEWKECMEKNLESIESWEKLYLCP